MPASPDPSLCGTELQRAAAVRHPPLVAEQGLTDPPALAIGHVSLRVSDVKVAAGFYRTLGLRGVMETPGLAILELRGGSHLMLFRAKGTPRAGRVRSFDLMLDGDIQVFRTSLEQAGLPVTEIADDRLSRHQWFEVTDPDGHVLSIYTSHTEGRPV